ncbi:MAG: nucleotide exchange factor GrpE, partial [Euryarchaeota archaeon]
MVSTSTTIGFLNVAVDRSTMPDEESDADEQSEEPVDEMAALQAKIDELQKELQYSKAETANARQRGLRDRTEAMKFGAAGLASKIIPA